MTRAVIFDMGGTLIRFVRPGNGTWREFELPGIRGMYQYLIEQGHPLASEEDAFVEAMFGRLAQGWQHAIGGQANLRAVEWIAAGTLHHALTLDDATLAEAAHRYARPMRQGLAAMTGAVELLATLRERGYRVGLISNTIWPANLHLEDLAQIGVLPYLEHTIFSGDFGAWKPNPAVFQQSLVALDASAEQSVFVGDSPREDVVGAQAVGMRAVWIRNREFPLADQTPDAIIYELPELLPILERWHA